VIPGGRLCRWAQTVFTCALGWFLLAPPARAQVLDDPAAQLAAWRREPLDLRRVDAAELALLPWLDAGLARAIVGLREAGGLHRLDDLLLVPGLDRDRLRAITPFVRLDSSTWGLGGFVEHFSRWSRDGFSRHTTRFRVHRGAFGLAGQAPRPTDPTPCLAGWWRGRELVLFVGDLRPRLGWPLLLADPAIRSRTAAPSLGRQMTLRGSISSRAGSWRGVGGSASLAGFRLLAAAGRVDGRSRPHSLIAVESSHGPLRVGAAVLDGAAASVWLAVERSALHARIEGGREFSGGQGSRWCAALRATEGGRSFGLALTLATPGVGQDPITGQPLDRIHRVLQADLRVHPGRWTLTALARARRRGVTGAVVDDLRWQLEGAGPLPRARLRVQWRQDEAPARGATRVWNLWLQERRDGHPVARSLRLRQERGASTRSLLVALALEGGDLWSWKIQLAGSRGDRSAPWTVGVPIAGVSPSWLAPQGGGVLFTLERTGSSLDLGGWVRLRGDRRGPPLLEGGLGLRWGRLQPW